MKVFEDGTDRRSEINLYSEGNLECLDEYGEYVDSNDGALCCYVPVEKGEKIRIGGKFNGTTITVHYDALIDGVCRKSNAYLGKVVGPPRPRRLDFDKFLFRTKDGILDTDLEVTDIPTDITVQQHAPHNLGTIEVRICVLRRFGDQHALCDKTVYYEVLDEGYNSEIAAGYDNVQPDFSMSFEKNCTLLDNANAKRLRKKLDAVRPGNVPWALFRFHYRSIEAIENSGLKQTYAHGWSKSKYAHRKLNIEPLPLLRPGMKPGDEVEDDANSTRQSSPIGPIAVLETHSGMSRAGTGQNTRPPSRELPANSTTTPTNSITKQTPPQDSPNPLQITTSEDIERLGRTFKKNPAALDFSSGHTMASLEDLVFAKAEDGKTFLAMDKVEDENNEELNSPVKDAEGVKKASDGHTEDTKSNGKSSGHTATTIARDSDKDTTRNSATPAAQSDTEASMRTSDSAEGKSVANTAPKRSAERTPPGSPVLKRNKDDSTSLFVTPRHSRRQSPSPSPSLSTGFTSMTQKLAASRQRIETAKAKRAELAKRQRQVDESLAPYLKQVQEEIDNMSKLAEEEEKDIAESEDHLRASIEMLKEYQNRNN